MTAVFVWLEFLRRWDAIDRVYNDRCVSADYADRAAVRLRDRERAAQYRTQARSELLAEFAAEFGEGP